MANTKTGQKPEELGFFAAAAAAVKAPAKGAAIGGILIGTLADALWARREYIRSTVQDTVDLVVLSSAAAAAKAKVEALGKIADVSDVEKTLEAISTYWETK